MKKILLGLLLVSLAAAPLLAQEDPFALSAARRALCRVEIERSLQRQVLLDGALIGQYLPTVHQSGSFLGVAVDSDGHIVLVVPPLWNDLAQTPSNVRVYNSQRDASPAKVIGIDQRHSLVVLHALTPTLFQPVIFEAFPETPTTLRYVQWNSPIVVQLRDSQILNVEKFPGLAEYRVSLAAADVLSGSPLFDSRGHLRGLIAELDPSRNHYYVVPSGTIQDSLKRILQGEKEIAAGWAGIFLEETRGARHPVWVRDLTPGGPAFNKLFPSDRIQSVNGTPIDSLLLFVKMIRQNAPLSLIKLGVQRTGRVVRTAFELGLKREKEMPALMMKLRPQNDPSALQATPVMVPKNRMRFNPGLFFAINDDPRAEGIEVSRVVQGEAGDQAGIEPGDVLLRVNNMPLQSQEDWQKVLSLSSGELLELRVRRAGKVIRVVIER